MSKQKNHSANATESRLPEDLATDIEACIPEAERILEIERDKVTAEEVHQAVFEWMHTRWQSAEPLDDEEFECIVGPLACLWGKMICEELGWDWAWVEVNGGEGPAILSPDRSRLVYPFSYFREKLGDRESVPTTFLLYRMFRDGLGPQPAPGAYEVFG